MTPVTRSSDNRGDRRGRSVIATRLISLAAMLVTFAFCYADVFRALWRQWSTNEANSHGYLIPWISLYVVWLRRRRLAELTPKPVWLVGAPALIGSLGLLVVGRLGGIVGFQEASLVISLWALVLLLLGWTALHLLWFPIGYLLFMMPVWDFATEPMYYPLQLFAATLGARILSLVGIPVYQSGTFLQLPNAAVEVAYACSGINLLMSIVAIGVLLAYLWVRSTARRVVLVAIAALVAAVANPVRVALIVFSYYAGLASPSQSHAWQSMAVSLVAFAVLFAAARWLGADNEVGSPGGESVPGRVLPSLSSWTVFAACALFLAGGVLRPVTPRSSSLAGARLDTVPTQLGEWQAVSIERPSDAVQNDEFWREYRRLGDGSVRVYIGRFAHRDAATGEIRYWSERFSNVSAMPVDVPTLGRFPVNRATALGGPLRGNVLYWFQLGQRSTVNRVAAKLAWTSWALTGWSECPLAVVLFVGGDGPASGAREEAQASIVRELAPALRQLAARR
jgi:EpsI family protein